MDVLVLGIVAAVALAVAGWLSRAGWLMLRSGRPVSAWTVVAATAAVLVTGMTAMLFVRADHADLTASTVGASDTPASSEAPAHPSPGPTGRSRAGRSPGPPLVNEGTPRIRTTQALYFGRPHETIPIPGRYRGVQGPRVLRVQVKRGGRWADSPWPVVTGRSGRFRAHVYLGAPGRYRLRIVDPGQHRTSRTLVLALF